MCIRDSMGTTAVCALVRGGNAFICHAGDSRAYLVRDGRLTQLTHDHSYAVSYTHLDVYKRQAQGRAPGHGFMPRTQLWMWSALSVRWNSAISLLSMGAVEAFSWA